MTHCILCSGICRTSNKGRLSKATSLLWMNFKIEYQSTIIDFYFVVQIACTLKVITWRIQCQSFKLVEIYSKGKFEEKKNYSQVNNAAGVRAFANLARAKWRPVAVTPRGPCQQFAITPSITVSDYSKSARRGRTDSIRVSGVSSCLNGGPDLPQSLQDLVIICLIAACDII